MEQLTEVETLKIENFSLRQHVMRQQFEQAIADRKNYIAEIERNHPNHKWDDQRGELVELPVMDAAVEESTSQ